MLRLWQRSSRFKLFKFLDTNSPAQNQCFRGPHPWVFDPALQYLARSPAGRILREGQTPLAGSFRRDGLITGYVVSVIPVVLGAGIPLFVAGGPLENLRLVASRAYPSGVVQLTYAKAG